MESENDVTCKYFSDSDTIELPLAKGSLHDYYSKSDIINLGILDKEEEIWRAWKASLVHEMLHEYEKKSKYIDIENGKILEEEMKLNNLFFADLHPDGYKHTFRFYAAVSDKACYFGMTPLELAKIIL